MAMLTIRNLPDDVHQALRVRAAQNGRSTEAEVRAIITHVVKPVSEVRMGDALFAVGRRHGLSRDDVEAMEAARDTVPAEPRSFA